jgi:hypothetical protein
VHGGVTQFFGWFRWGTLTPEVVKLAEPAPLTSQLLDDTKPMLLFGVSRCIAASS